jgi:hypothetical protein
MLVSGGDRRIGAIFDRISLWRAWAETDTTKKALLKPAEWGGQVHVEFQFRRGRDLEAKFGASFRAQVARYIVEADR